MVQEQVRFLLPFLTKLNTMTITLNRIYEGYYAKRAGNIEVTVSNPKVSLGSGSNAWQLTITKGEQEQELVNEWFDKKKDAYQFATNYIINNL